MAGMSRRKALGTAAAAAAGGGLASGIPAEAAPGAQGAAPRHPVELEAEPAKAYPGGTTKSASVRNFPISQAIAGVSMRLQPRAIREMHWHSNAAEWGYYMSGRARLTIVSPRGQWETIVCDPGDLAYI